MPILLMSVFQYKPREQKTPTLYLNSVLTLQWAGLSCNRSEPGRLTWDLGSWKKVGGALRMPDRTLFRGGVTCAS